VSNELIKALQNPTLYDHPTEGFKVLETHISWVILTGPFAYKIKKPVNFGFLDFSSLEKRKHFCEQELHLNRRLAPSLYLDVVTISGSVTHPALDTKTGSDENPHIFEYALKMTQFPQEGILSTLQEKQVLTSKHINELSTILASFHQRVEIAPINSTYGMPGSVLAPIEENFKQIQSRLKTLNLECTDTLHSLKEWALSSFQQLRPIIEARKTQGFIRECHGDLHLGNITLFNDALVIFDCIEFNPSLRWVDVISDLAFLIMDLEKRGQNAYANQLCNAYMELTGDYEGIALLKFYKSYRAMVRAKVAVLSIKEEEDTTEAKRSLMKEYQQYINLADKYEAIPNRYILLMHGYSGSGKSVVSNTLVEELGAIRIRSDVERKRLYSYMASDRTDSPLNGGIYTEEATQKTYDRIVTLASTLLEGGLPIIVDATHLKKWQRNLLLQEAESHAVPLLIISCCAADEVLKERIEKRSNEKLDASEAGIKTLKNQKQTAEALSNSELSYTLHVHTDQEGHLTKLIKEVKHHFRPELIL